MTCIFGFEERLRYLRQHGSHCMSYATLQPGMKYVDVPGVGYLAYQLKWGTRYVLTDPVCAHEHVEVLIDAAMREHSRLCFVQVSDSCAQVLSRKGFLLNSLGVENTIDLEEFRVSWNTRRDLKRWMSALGKAGVRVQEGLDGIHCSDIKSVSDEWLAAKLVRREMAFMARPCSFDHEEGVRTFCAIDKGRLSAFCTFDPSFGPQIAVSGYLLCHLRSRQGSRSGILDYIVVNAARVMKEEGVQYLHLGISPLYQMDNSRYRCSWFTTLLLGGLYRYGNRLFGFRSLGFHKDRYRARKHQTYLGTQGSFTFFNILAILRLTQII